MRLAVFLFWKIRLALRIWESQMETSNTKSTAPAAQFVLAKKAAAVKAKAKPAGLPTSLIAADRKHRTKQALAGTPEKHFEHDQTRVHAPRAPPDTRLLSKPKVLAIANVTYPTLWAWMRNGTFPRSRVVGGRSMWLSTEVDAWIAGLPVRRLKGDAAAELNEAVNDAATKARRIEAQP
jgi:predicted DNA-binding transcriptional regulator AlpA